MTDTDRMCEHCWDILADALASHDADAASRAWAEIARVAA